MPRSNPAFEKALALLAHPLSLAAIALLLINDHLLRALWPSWWTGKLGDLAWLFFVPFVLAAFLSWIVPPRLCDGPRHERLVFGLSFTLIGAGFILVKLLPAANVLVGRAFFAVTGATPSLILDPSDLLALPALAASFWLWRGAPAQMVFSPRAVVALPLAALLLLADAAAPDPGITCFEIQNGRVYASAGYQSYVTSDGGLTWSPSEAGTSVRCSPGDGLTGEELLADWREAPGPDPATRYRYQAGVEIQRSTDSGQTWQTVHRVEQVSDAQLVYLTKSASGNPTFEPVPLHALADPASGNMLFAMGHQGVLVYTAAGEWVWAMGSEYQHIEDFPTADAFMVLLGGMILLAAELALILYSALALRWTRHWLRIVVVVIAALGWLIVAALFPPAANNGYFDAVTWLGILAVAVLVLPLVIEQSVRLARRAPRAILPMAGFGLLGGLLFFLPYVLWLYSTLPGFYTATIFSLILAAAVLAAGYLVVRGSRLLTAN
jgi:hypothetical protein